MHIVRCHQDEKAVWQGAPRHRAQHLCHRRQGHPATRPARHQGTQPRRRSAGDRARPLTHRQRAVARNGFDPDAPWQTLADPIAKPKAFGYIGP
ncbi:hypothetical protein CBM2634_A160214 [Cupriavidus taiwanensis]|uniref:Uncharacterized protein n=1 Tax=Cupriavidus taiwanensis TaxID=164546 RepID=A0A375IW83_9BURK|nr:hypothetical protein CBM2634_A160214 [Cupriavidus taiwanensis]